MPYFGIKKSKIIWCQKCIISQYLELDKLKGSDFKYDMKDFLSFKIDNKSNSFLVNYCIVKWPKRH